MANHEGDARRAVHPLTRPVAETGSGSPETGKSPKKSLYERLTGVLKKRLVCLGLATGVIGLGVGGVYAYQHDLLFLPAVHRTISDTGEKIGLTDVPISSTFDNTKEKQMFGDNNIKRITPKEAEIQNLLTPKFDETNKTLTIMSPFVIPEGTSATIDKSTYEVRTIEHNTPRFIVPAGTEIVIPKGMHYRLVGGNSDLKQDPNFVYGLTALQYDKETNISASLNFYLFDKTKGEEIPLFTNLPIMPYEDLYPGGIIDLNSLTIEYWMQLPVSDGVMPIGITTSNQLIYIYHFVIKGDKPNAPEIKNTELQLQQQDGKLLVLAPSDN